MSGNTQEVAYFLKEVAEDEGFEVVMHRMEVDVIPDIKKFDAMFIGTYTWHEGSTPDEVKDFVADIGYKPDNVFVFGTGDTQFGGDDLFCYAVDKLDKFYNTKIPGLKIEQSPRGTQKTKVIKWMEGVLTNDEVRKS